MTREEILPIAKPILFNTEMTIAILDNRKKATRRIVKGIIPFDDKRVYFNAFKRGQWTGPMTKEQIIEEYAPCKVGDYLYVRETWSTWTDGYVYKAWTSPFPQPGRYNDEFMTWHPSIHMPKDAARIFLKVTDVRFEQLQDMDTSNKEHFVAEGAKDKHDFIRIWYETMKLDEREKYGWYANPWVWAIEFERVED